MGVLGRTEEALKEDRRILELFMEKLEINRDGVQGLSYSDLIEGGEREVLKDILYVMRTHKDL